MFLRVMAWKELREQRLQMLLLTLLGVLILGVVFPLMGDRSSGSLTTAAMAAIVFAWAGGMVTGAVALANERETQTQTFLDMMPRWRRQIWAAKLFVALVLVVIQSLLFGSVSMAANRDVLPVSQMRDLGGVALFSLLSGLFGLGCGMAGSAKAQTVLAAIGWSMIALILSIAATGIAVGLLQLLVATWAQLRGSEAAALSTLGWMLTIPLPMTLSALIYTRLDRQRRFADRPTIRPRFRVVSGGFGMGPTLWLSLRQGWPLIVGLIVIAIVAAPLHVVEPLVGWPVLTLLVGVLMGVATLGDEQFYAAFRFLADQRLPLGRFWLFKLGSRFLIATLLVVICALAAIFAFEISRQFKGPMWLDRRPGVEGVMVRQLDLWAFLPMWGLYGFAFGHLASMLARKSVVAFAIAMLGSLMGLVAWVPSLVSGGLPAWQIALLPMAMLIFARISVWAWATDRLLTRRWVQAWGVATVIGVALVIGPLANRVLEVPAAATPFDVAEFQARFPTRDQNPIRAKLLLAEERFDHSAAARRLPQFAAAPIGFTGRLGGDRVLLTLVHGWPKNASVEQALGEAAAQGNWIASLVEAAREPMMPVDLPGDDTLTTRSASQRVAPLATWVAFRALYVQSTGMNAEALDLLLDELALARRLMSCATRRAYSNALIVENCALLGLQRWCERPGVPPALLERALKEAQRHDAERPPYLDVIKAEHVRLRDYQTGAADPFYNPSILDDEEWQTALVDVAVRMPWEKKRRERLLNNYTALRIQAAALDYPTLSARMAYRPPDPSVYSWLFSYADLNDTEGQRRCSRIANGLGHDLIFMHVSMFLAMNHDRGRFFGECDCRALQLRLALLIFQHRYGKLPEKLDELMPSLLASLPIDPFSGALFRYRVISEDEWVDWREEVRPGEDADWHTAAGMQFNSLDREAARRRLAAGTALVWSAGPNGVDDGGTSQFQSDLPGRELAMMYRGGHDDILYPVPVVKK
jgi:hypothetical protein